MAKQEHDWFMGACYDCGTTHDSIVRRLSRKYVGRLAAPDPCSASAT